MKRNFNAGIYLLLMVFGGLLFAAAIVDLNSNESEAACTVIRIALIGGP